MNSIFIHEDERRKLIEWIQNDTFKTAKVVIAKGNQVVGNHYHLKKDEAFLLLSGKAKRVIIGDMEEKDILPLKKWYVPRGTYHLFELAEGSILLGVASEPFNIEDEIVESEGMYE